VTKLKSKWIGNFSYYKKGSKEIHGFSSQHPPWNGAFQVRQVLKKIHCGKYLQAISSFDERA